MFKKGFPLFILLLSFLHSSAQDAMLKGKILDGTGKPIEGVSIVVEENQKLVTTTNAQGEYELHVPAAKKLTIVYSSLTTVTIRKPIELTAGEVKVMDITAETKVKQLPDVEIKDETNRKQGVTEIETKGTTLPDASGGGIEAYLAAQGLGVQKSNELSSNYSVRGGNFDENLVYVNDFEVYRPYLVRSGQQEGLSFANPDLVSGIKFTSGGFQSKYGDKMSSVLDVSYKRPKGFAGSASMSLLGGRAHIEGCDKSQRFTFLVGVRQKTSQYLLNSLDTKGEYSPNFLDVQAYLTYLISPKLSIEYISNYARNRYNFIPVDRETKFGVVNQAIALKVYYDGEEADRYQSFMNGLSLIYHPKENMTIKFLGSAYINSEQEKFDINGQYYLGQVESDQSKANFGQVINYSLGTGGLHNWARNTLNSNIYFAATRGSWFKGSHNLQWGVDYKREVIQDKISEWDVLDSAGYSLPFHSDTTAYFSRDSISLNRVLKSSFNLKSNRITAFLQDTWKLDKDGRFTFNYGVRFQYWDVNKEPIVTPRAQFAAKPSAKKNIILTLAGGLYYQPPFYREMRALDGTVNTHLKSQKSAQIVAGLNYAFKAGKVPFNFVTEAYYKQLWDLVPYELNDDLIRYYGQNRSKGYAGGVDVRLNGELVPGEESWINLSVMNTREYVSGENHWVYYDSTHTKLSNTSANRPYIRDSSYSTVTAVARPTDQLVTFALYFQDHIPKFKFIKVHISLIFGSGLPFGPPDGLRYNDVFRAPFYRRVDIGFSGQLWSKDWSKKKGKTAGNIIKAVWASIDIFNILGVSNTVSYLWVKDFNNVYYGVPNYLTSRRINGRIVVNF